MNNGFYRWLVFAVLVLLGVLSSATLGMGWRISGQQSQLMESTDRMRDAVLAGALAQVIDNPVKREALSKLILQTMSKDMQDEARRLLGYRPSAPGDERPRSAGGALD